jgi:hypothetical protein
MSYTLDEINLFKKEKGIIIEKASRLRQALIIATDESVKFKLETELRELDTARTDLDRKISDGYDLGTDSGKEYLREKVRELRLSEDMGRLHLVNCNRQEIRDRFEEGFDRRKAMGVRNHFYFISACTRQLPPSLGERMVYELLGDLLDEGPNTVFCRFNPAFTERIAVKKLPIGYDENRSKQLFREFCAAWFDWEKDLPFETAIAENRLPLARHQYSILPFTINQKEWKPFFPDYFEWIAAELEKRGPGGPTLLVFFIVYVDDLHKKYDADSETFNDQKAQAIIQGVHAACEKHPAAGYFFPLYPVDETDLRDWFFDLGENGNTRIDPILKRLAETLPPEEAEQYRNNKKINMERIEQLQEIVFDWHHKNI